MQQGILDGMLPRKTRKMTATQAYARAIDLHRERRLPEAEKIYRAILQLDENHVGALHNLGTIRTQQGLPGEAIGLIGRAVELEPSAADAHNDLGMALAMLGRFEEAIAQYHKALAIRPDFVAAHSNLANVLVAFNRPAEAIAQLEKALALRPESAELHNNFGNALSALNRHDEAMAHYQKALAIRPDFAQVHNNLGAALAALGRQGQAIAHYEQAIELKPAYAEAQRNLGKTLLNRGQPAQALPHMTRAFELRPDAESHNDLGNTLAMLGRHQEAISHYEKALTSNPGFARAHNNLGNALATSGRHEEAIAHFHQALAIVPDYPEAQSNLGNTLLKLHRAEAAIPCFERALAARPNMPQAHNGLGGALQTLGRLAESRRAFERAIGFAPDNAAYYHALGAVKRFARGDPHLLAMQALAHDMDALRPDDRIALHFALGKAYADIGEHEQAFRHYSEGNAQHRVQVTYDQALTLAGFDRLKQVFTSSFMRGRQGCGEPSEAPVFIVGMPRSGTTLVEQILASHPQIFGAGELHDMGRIAASIRWPNGSLGFPEFVPSMSDQQLRVLGKCYVANATTAAPSAARITDKMPGNFYFAGLIRLMLPNARIIHVRRDPVDTCLSLFTHLFVGELTWTDDLGEIGRYYRAYASLMEHWRAVLPDGAVLEVQYENLVADLEPQARRLIAYCGLDWDNRCLLFHATERPVWTASVAQVRQPIYRDAIGRSRPYLPMLGALLEALGDSR